MRGELAVVVVVVVVIVVEVVVVVAPCRDAALNNGGSWPVAIAERYALPQLSHAGVFSSSPLNLIISVAFEPQCAHTFK